MTDNDFHVLDAMKGLHLSQAKKLAPQTCFTVLQIIQADGNRMSMQSSLGALHSLQRMKYVLKCTSGYTLTDAGKKAKALPLLAQAA